MPTLKVKQNGVWKVISTAGNSNSAKDYSAIIVTYDTTTMIASLNSIDIFNLVNEGRNIILNSEGVIYSLISVEENLASFFVTTVGDEVSGTVYITIDNNKQVKKIIYKGTTIPIPTKNDTNKILSVGTDNNVQWINAPSGGGSSEGESSSSIQIDSTLTISGQAADAKVVGDKIGDLSTLTTTDTNNLVEAINEINAKETTSSPQIQSDWEQEDNTVLDFIKNKPFNENFISLLADSADSVTVTTTVSENDAAIYIGSFTETQVLTQGHIYKIQINDNTYITEAKIFNLLGSNIYYLGNISLFMRDFLGSEFGLYTEPLGGDETGEDYCITTSSLNATEFKLNQFLTKASASNTYIIKITDITYNLIDKYTHLFQNDWNETDPTHHRYIINKPFSNTNSDILINQVALSNYGADGDKSFTITFNSNDENPIAFNPEDGLIFTINEIEYNLDPLYYGTMGDMAAAIYGPSSSLLMVDGDIFNIYIELLNEPEINVSVLDQITISFDEAPDITSIISLQRTATKQIKDRYIPNPVQRLTMEANKDDYLKIASVDFLGRPTFLQPVKNPLIAGGENLVLRDSENDYEYVIAMKNGNLVSECKCSKIAVTTKPTKTAYVTGEYFDPTGMIITATRQDGTTKEITNYDYNFKTTAFSSTNTKSVSITYIEAGTTYSTTVAVTVTKATS